MEEKELTFVCNHCGNVKETIKSTAGNLEDFMKKIKTMTFVFEHELSSRTPKTYCKKCLDIIGKK